MLKTEGWAYLRLLQIPIFQDLGHALIFIVGTEFALEGLLRRRVVSVLGTMPE